MRLSCYWGTEYHTTTKEYCNLCAIYGTTVSAYDTNNCKGLLAIAWGYKFLQSWGAKDCLAMNHLNEWTLGKRKQNTNRPKQPRIQSCGWKQAKITKAKLKHSYLLTFTHAGQDLDLFYQGKKRVFRSEAKNKLSTAPTESTRAFKKRFSFFSNVHWISYTLFGFSTLEKIRVKCGFLLSPETWKIWESNVAKKKKKSFVHVESFFVDLNKVETQWKLFSTKKKRCVKIWNCPLLRCSISPRSVSSDFGERNNFCSWQHFFFLPVRTKKMIRLKTKACNANSHFLSEKAHLQWDQEISTLRPEKKNTFTERYVDC